MSEAWREQWPTQAQVDATWDDPEGWAQRRETHRTRASAVAKHLAEYHDPNILELDKRSMELQLGDLIANLLHVAELYELDFDRALANGKWQFTWNHIAEDARST